MVDVHALDLRINPSNVVVYKIKLGHDALLNLIHPVDLPLDHSIRLTKAVHTLELTYISYYVFYSTESDNGMKAISFKCHQSRY